MDPLEWRARLSDHIPNPGEHRTLFYGERAGRVRSSGESAAPEAEAGEEHKPRRRPAMTTMLERLLRARGTSCCRKPPTCFSTGGK